MKPGSRLRWRVAHWIDRLPGMCWANVVSWALYGGRDHPLRECRVNWMCREDTARNGSCYCGKVRADTQGLDTKENRTVIEEVPGEDPFAGTVLGEALAGLDTKEDSSRKD